MGLSAGADDRQFASVMAMRPPSMPDFAGNIECIRKYWAGHQVSGGAGRRTSRESEVDADHIYEDCVVQGRSVLPHGYKSVTARQWSRFLRVQGTLWFWQN